MSSTALLLSVNVVASNLKREKENNLENFNVCIRIMQKRESAIFFTKKNFICTLFTVSLVAKLRKSNMNKYFIKKLNAFFQLHTFNAASKSSASIKAQILPILCDIIFN